MNYRGYNLSQDNPYSNEWYATDPDADYDWLGVEDGGYVQCSGMPGYSGQTLQDVKDEIDNYFAELELS